jgi:hypothetical protein
MPPYENAKDFAFTLRREALPQWNVHSKPTQLTSPLAPKATKRAFLLSDASPYASWTSKETPNFVSQHLKKRSPIIQKFKEDPHGIMTSAERGNPLCFFAPLRALYFSAP